jgi:hypothetical protein
MIAAVALAALSLATAAPPPGLTPSGRLLWQFDALLHDTFGRHPVCMSLRHGGLDFVDEPCTPHAVYSPYRPTFANARKSAFHVSDFRGSGFGNYPVPVLIRGHGIACDRLEDRFLIEYSDAAAFTLACLAPHSEVNP